MISAISGGLPSIGAKNDLDYTTLFSHGNAIVNDNVSAAYIGEKIEIAASLALEQSRRLGSVAIGGACTATDDCSGANQVCSNSGVCLCDSGHYLPSGTSDCLLVQAGSYPVQNITYNATKLGWIGIAASADFTVMLATVSYGQIYKSVDSGGTWNAITNGKPVTNSGIACNADCSKIAVCRNNSIHLSPDGGSTWTDPDSEANSLKDVGFISIVANANFTKFVATTRAPFNGYSDSVMNACELKLS